VYNVKWCHGDPRCPYYFEQLVKIAKYMVDTVGRDEGKSILDVGAGDGLLGHLLRIYGFRGRIDAVEIDNKKAYVLKQSGIYGRVFENDFLEMRYLEYVNYHNSYDAVAMINFLYAFGGVLVNLVLDTASLLVKRRGHVFFTFTNRESPITKFLAERGIKKSHTQSREEIIDACFRAGLDPRFVHDLSMWIVPFSTGDKWTGELYTGAKAMLKWIKLAVKYRKFGPIEYFVDAVPYY